jgi:hypothetical protein
MGQPEEQRGPAIEEEARLDEPDTQALRELWAQGFRASAEDGFS